MLIKKDICTLYICFNDIPYINICLFKKTYVHNNKSLEWFNLSKGG